MNTSLAAASALSVSTPSDGAQSMNTKSKHPSSWSSRSRRMTSRPTTPASSTSAAARLMSEPATQRFSATLRRTSASGRELTSTSYIDGDLPSGSMPRWVVAWAWGSRSRTQTRWPRRARAAARLTAVVVLPTPPFWLMIAIRRMACPRVLAFGSGTPGGIISRAGNLGNPKPGQASEQVDHVLPAVLRVAGQPPVLRVDDEVEQFQRHLANEDRAIIRQVGHVHVTIAPLNGEPHGRIDPCRDDPRTGAELLL